MLKYLALALWFAGSLSAAYPLAAQDFGEGTVQEIYEAPNMAGFAQLYWAMGKMDVTNDVHIDNYLAITQCDLFRDYYHNDFEWRKIREATRTFLNNSKESFPLRYEFVQPILLGEYDFERRGFHVLREYKVQDMRRFEVRAEDAGDTICGLSDKLEGYPSAIILEFSRSLTLDFVAMEPEQAERFIAKKAEILKDPNIAKNFKKKEDYYSLRDTYLIMKVKFFTYKEDVKEDGREYATMIAALEGVELYSSYDRKELLYSENLLTKKKNRVRTRKPKTVDVTAEEQGVETSSEIPAQQ